MEKTSSTLARPSPEQPGKAATLRIMFKNVGSGLIARNGPELTGFAIAGKDRRFGHAMARIRNDTVILWSDMITRPVAVRYTWAANPICNLYNKEGLPAVPLRADDWPGITWPRKK